LHDAIVPGDEWVGLSGRQPLKNKRKILFLSHSASRNGATILLLHLLRWLKDKSEDQFEVVVNGRGPLLDEFRELFPTRVWRSPDRLVAGLSPAWKAKLGPRLGRQFLRMALRGGTYDLAYVNTAASWHHLPFIATRSQGVLWHIHEMGYALRTVAGEEALRCTFPLAKRFVAVSQSVKEVMVNEFSVPAERVDMVHGFVNVRNRTPENAIAQRAKIRRELGLADDVFVVGGCGTLGWRKGTDLFLKIAQTLVKRWGDKCAFLWVGGGTQGEDALQFAHEMRILGLEKFCRWIPNTAQALEYYHAMDVFALTSREDPFPLVMLEAGAAGLPTVCFAQSGGGPEFVSRNTGLLAPYLDTELFARQLSELQLDGELRKKLGAEASRRVATCHAVETQAPLLLNTMEQCMRTK